MRRNSDIVDARSWDKGRSDGQEGKEDEKKRKALTSSHGLTGGKIKSLQYKRVTESAARTRICKISQCNNRRDGLYL